MHKLEFCLFALSNLIEDEDKDLSDKLVKLANESHYYNSNNEEGWRSDSLYEELFEKIENKRNLK